MVEFSQQARARSALVSTGQGVLGPEELDFSGAFA